MTYDGLAERAVSLAVSCPAALSPPHTPAGSDMLQSRTTPAFAIKIINNREGFSIDDAWRHFSSCKQLATKKLSTQTPTRM